MTLSSECTSFIQCRFLQKARGDLPAPSMPLGQSHSCSFSCTNPLTKRFLPCLGRPGDDLDIPLCIFSLSSIYTCKNMLIRVFSNLDTQKGLWSKVFQPSRCVLRKQEYEHLLLTGTRVCGTCSLSLGGPAWDSERFPLPHSSAL